MFDHVTVLLKEAVEGLNIKADGIYVDCTLGHLYCFDQDQTAIEAARLRLDAVGNNYTIIYSNFVNIKEKLNELGVTRVDGILFDLGVSSPQFDTGSRGFSYNYDARLDMRMDTSNPLDAYAIVNTWPYERIVEILYKYADEKFAKQIARKIEQKRQIRPIETTFELVDIIKDAIPAFARRKGGHPAKRTFQALRIAVNDELNVFDRALKDSLDLLNVGGRISVITFHSLEDKICKYTFNDVTKLKDVPPGLPVIPDYLQPRFKLINKKAMVASKEELEVNHRAHSAKLRIIEREFEAFSQRFLVISMVIFVFGIIGVKSMESSYNRTAQVLEKEIKTIKSDIDSLEMQKQELASFSRLSSVANAKGYTYSNDSVAASTQAQQNQ